MTAEAVIVLSILGAMIAGAALVMERQDRAAARRQREWLSRRPNPRLGRRDW